MATKAALIAQVPLFARCSKKEIGRIAAIATRVSAQEGDVIIQEGTSGGDFHIVAGGDAEVTVGGKRIRKLGPGDYFGEMSLLGNRPRSATVTALSRMVLYVIEGKDFASMLDTTPSVTLNILTTLSARLRAAEGGPTYDPTHF
jgi:CRP-like cAMP-binding protein